MNFHEYLKKHPMKPNYEEFTPEEIEDLDDTCAELAEENSQLQDQLLVIHKESAAFRERAHRLEFLNAELLAALKLWMSPYLEEHPGFTSNLIEQSRQAIAKAEAFKP